MRSTLFFAVASALSTAVAALEGSQVSPTATPSICLTTPTDVSCSNYTIAAASITSSISEICKASSFLPGCSLYAACTADSTLNATYCAPLTILASLCTPVEDSVLTSPVCAKSYSIFCATGSKIPDCKSRTALPGLPSGKLVTGTVYSICQEMPTMTDCKLCPGPDATTGYSNCDEVKAWKGLCLDMPDMTQCSSFNTMCKNTGFAPFCSNSYKAPSGGATPSSGGASPVPTDNMNHGQQTPNSASILYCSSVMASLLALAISVIATAL
ncbi:hypothetical protein BGZ99_004884 [Dissophora globulifera]|uniref:Uncharacterized protein n=1 Tax=Dissophora globulifera TaxID=979702 RepID=A0A9P6RLE6_9FUNG|nr:hypothetical protein BGZ99_004884 [Dissophora globulifera]